MWFEVEEDYAYGSCSRKTGILIRTPLSLGSNRKETGICQGIVVRNREWGLGFMVSGRMSSQQLIAGFLLYDVAEYMLQSFGLTIIVGEFHRFSSPKMFSSIHTLECFWTPNILTLLFGIFSLESLNNSNFSTVYVQTCSNALCTCALPAISRLLIHPQP